MQRRRRLSCLRICLSLRAIGIDRRFVYMTSSSLIRDLQYRFAGVLLGAAVGDALGLPAENLSPERIRKRWSGEWRMRFLFGRGMISDDTEHTLMGSQALLSHSDDGGGCLRGVRCE